MLPVLAFIQFSFLRLSYISESMHICMDDIHEEAQKSFCAFKAENKRILRWSYPRDQRYKGIGEGVEDGRKILRASSFPLYVVGIFVFKRLPRKRVKGFWGRVEFPFFLFLFVWCVDISYSSKYYLIRRSFKLGVVYIRSIVGVMRNRVSEAPRI